MLCIRPLCAERLVFEANVFWGGGGGVASVRKHKVNWVEHAIDIMGTGFLRSSSDSSDSRVFATQGYLQMRLMCSAGEVTLKA